MKERTEERHEGRRRSEGKKREKETDGERKRKSQRERERERETSVHNNEAVRLIFRPNAQDRVVQICGVGHVTIMQMQTNILFVGILIQMINALCIER